MKNNRIKELRNQKGMTAKKLSEISNIPYDSIKNYEYGRREPSGSALVAISKAFNVNPAYILGYIDNPNPNIELSWQDEEINSAVNECLPNLFRNTLKASLQLDEHSKKMIFDIMVELLHTVSIENKTEAGIILGALQETFSSTTRFSDICIGFSQKTDYEKDRLTKAQASTLNEFQKTISDVREKLIK
ncbi:MAG: helix-turn-helix transcriptional regulator [Oscillospiraceae bacterium]